MKYFNTFVFCFFLSVSLLQGTEFTVGSYNCGGLTDHYDYLRAASMERLMQERHISEPEYMSLNEKIQKLALKILFSNDPIEKKLAKQEWEEKKYTKYIELLTEAPTYPSSINKLWSDKAKELMTSYRVRPVTIYNQKVNQMIDQHLSDLNKVSDLSREEQLEEARKIMAIRIFENHLNYDILCLQEAEYLDASFFPESYEVLLTESDQSKVGIAWNKDRFELVNSIEGVLERALAVKLLDKETQKIVLIASGHMTGCDPYRVEKNGETGESDSAKGDRQVQKIVNFFDEEEADLMIIGMDSNVTSLHPRLKILKNAGYKLDYENYLEPTCTNPHQLLNTRIDWILLKTHLKKASIVNIPVLSVGLNNIQTNMSDHKPIGAKIIY